MWSMTEKHVGRKFLSHAEDDLLEDKSGFEDTRHPPNSPIMIWHQAITTYFQI